MLYISSTGVGKCPVMSHITQPKWGYNLQQIFLVWWCETNRQKGTFTNPWSMFNSNCGFLSHRGTQIIQKNGPFWYWKSLWFWGCPNFKIAPVVVNYRFLDPWTMNHVLRYPSDFFLISQLGMIIPFIWTKKNAPNILTGASDREWRIHFINIFMIIPATPSNPSIPCVSCVKRTSLVFGIPHVDISIWRSSIQCSGGDQRQLLFGTTTWTEKNQKQTLGCS